MRSNFAAVFSAEPKASIAAAPNCFSSSTPCLMASSPTNACKAPEMAPLIWSPALSPASPISSRSFCASSAPSPTASEDSRARCIAFTRLIPIRCTGFFHAAAIPLVLVTRVDAKALNFPREKSSAPVSPVPKLFAVLCPAFRPSFIAPRNAAPRLSASCALRRSCVRNPSVLPPASRMLSPSARAFPAAFSDASPSEATSFAVLLHCPPIIWAAVPAPRTLDAASPRSSDALSAASPSFSAAPAPV